MTIKKILLSIIFSQIWILGVFGLEKKEYFVIEHQKEICGSFLPGTSTQPNWLPDTWSNNKCLGNNFASCCAKKGFLYVGPVGDPSISTARKSAEFLASKKIIESWSLSPNKYQLQNTITRKEMMKIISNISKIKLNSTCSGNFADVENDWGCKYIEGALQAGFIAQNTNFRPNASLTQAEALKLIFQARKLDRRYQTNSWQQDYISSALYLGFIDEKSSNFNISATRGWIFQALAKTYEKY